MGGTPADERRRGLRERLTNGDHTNLHQYLPFDGGQPAARVLRIFYMARPRKAQTDLDDEQDTDISELRVTIILPPEVVKMISEDLDVPLPLHGDDDIGPWLTAHWNELIEERG